MRLIETDTIVAVASIGDRRHERAVEIIRGDYGHLCVSPYALIELDLLIQSGRIKVSNQLKFYDGLAELIDYYDLEPLVPRPAYHAAASNLRRDNVELTFFDSLHAAVSIVEGAEMISFDRVYDRIGGIKRLRAEAQ